MFLSLVLLSVTYIQLISCGCKESFMTICDNFEDLNNHNDIENLKEVIIGSDSESNFTSVSLMDALPLQKFNKLTSLIVLRKINQLDIKTYAFQCTYHTSPLKYFSLYGNELKQIEPYHFPVVPLKKLSLVNNKIEAIKGWAFKFHEIENFDVSDNLLEVVENEALPSTNATKVITIRNNQLTHIEPGSFTSSLRSLNLDKNKLRHLQDEILADLVNLEELTLSHNKFNSLPNIKHLKKLIIFDISSNNIATIKPGTFTNMDHLKLLDLSNNKITSKDVLKWILSPNKQPKLTVSLALNRLSSLNLTGGYIQEQSFVLYGNPWDCNEWEDFRKQITGHDRKCDLQFFSSGSTPYCINYRAGSYVFTSLWENDVNRFHEVVQKSAKTFECRLNPLRNGFLDPVSFGCVA